MNSELASRYQQLMRKIAALSPAGHRTTLIAVSKSQPVEAIEALYSLGHRDFGENYAQELIEKARVLQADGCTGIRWHFIGHLQTNKVKAVIPYIHSIHSVDSERLANELSKRWRETHDNGNAHERLSCFIEVNLDGEDSKSGAAPQETPALAALIAAQHPALQLEGLMGIPAAGRTPEALAQTFATLRELELKCRPHTSGHLSMGMSGDFEIAIAQGATHVRVGTALFGAR